MKRRQAVKRLATLGLAGIVYPGCGRQSLGLLDVAGNIVDGTRDSLTPPACVLTPRQTAGPFYFHSGELRQDISEGRPGVVLRLSLTIVGTDPCAPVQGAAVDIWHADAAGLYSGFDDAVLDPTGGTQADFMRGMQRTDAEGKVKFVTRWPGWYPNRTVHVHVNVQLPTGQSATSQFYFPEALNDEILALAPYAGRGARDRRNNNDPVLRTRDLQKLQMTVLPTASGYRAWHTIGIRTG